MYFRLAETLGMPVAELLRRMTSEELTEWLLFFKLQAEEMEHPKRQSQMLNEVKREHGHG